MLTINLEITYECPKCHVLFVSRPNRVFKWTCVMCGHKEEFDSKALGRARRIVKNWGKPK